MTAVRLPAVFLIAGFVFGQPVPDAKSASTPNASEIIKHSVATNTADWKAQPDYSYCARYKKSKVDASGNAKVEERKTYQTSMIGGSPYERVIAIDNEPLSREQQQQEQIKLNREIARRRSESPSQRQARMSKYQSQRAEEHLLMQQMIDAFTFTMAGEQRVNGVDCYVLNALPNPAYRPPVQKARVLVGMRGRLWVDKENYHWVKVQAEVINPVEFGVFVAKVKPGTKFELEQAPVGDVWLPKHFSESVNASVFGLCALHSREDEDYSGYTLLAAKSSQPAAGVNATSVTAPPKSPARTSELAAR